MALTGGPISRNKIIYQAGKGGELRYAYELARVNAQFASGAVGNRDYNLGTATTTAVAPFVVPHDMFVTEIRAFVQNQGATDVTTFDVHYSEPASGQYTIFPQLSDRPSITGAVSIASGVTAVSGTPSR